MRLMIALLLPLLLVACGDKEEDTNVEEISEEAEAPEEAEDSGESEDTSSNEE